jgi:Type II secretory pathway, component PulD
MRTRLLVPATLLATVALAPSIFAQEAASTPDSAAAPETKVAVSKSKDTLTVDFPDEEIRNVLRYVADLFELNLVIPDTLQGKTSIKLRDVTWRQIFQVVLAPVGYTYIEDGNIIKVVTAESLNMEPVSTEVFILNYAKAAEVKPSLDAMVEAKVGGKIVVDARSNALIVTERPSAIQRIRPIVERLDRATDQVMIETKFIEVSDSVAKDLGVDWSVLKGYKVGSTGPIETEYERSNGRTSSAGYKEDGLDVDFMNNGYNRAGRLNNVNGTVGPKITDGALEGIGPMSEIENVFTNNVSRVTTAVFSASQFNLTLNALQAGGGSKLVSNPTVVTLNNTEASINVGQEYPIPNYTYNQEQGRFEVSGFTYKPIGVILKVTPQVNAAGFIKLTVAPEVSSRDESKDVQFGDARIPVVSIRKTETQVTLKDGYTLGIGGLLDSTATNSQTKVPLLGDIPGLGRLFRSDSQSKRQQNMLIFITARTVKPDGGTVGEIFDPRMVREMKLTKDELPGFRDGSDPFVQPEVPEPKKGMWKKKK